MDHSNMTHTIGVALSGGVDSTVTAGLLMEQGFSVHGFFMLLPLPGLEEQLQRVKRVAAQLQIPLHQVDLRQRFKQTVISYFVDSYRQGLTPNPCVICNRTIKCGLLLEAMLAMGMGKMATGHYAGIALEDGHPVLRRAADPAKDQSYFLARLSADQLGSLVLPLGNRHKKDVYSRAQEMGFTDFMGSESQDVCFLADRGLRSFLADQGVQSSPGDMVTADGLVRGRHDGIWNFTVGQRRGLGLPDATPWYVTGLDAGKNRVIIGKKEELFKSDLFLGDLQWAIRPGRQWRGNVQLRSRHRAAEAWVRTLDNNCAQVCFDKPQRAVTPGQFAVFYQNGRVVGSGVIHNTETGDR